MARENSLRGTATHEANSKDASFSCVLSDIFFDPSSGLYELPGESFLQYHLSSYDLYRRTWYDAQERRQSRALHSIRDQRMSSHKDSEHSRPSYIPKLTGSSLKGTPRFGGDARRGPGSQPAVPSCSSEPASVDKTHSNQLVCSSCDKIFNSRRGFHFHAVVHNGATPFSCISCGAKFRAWVQLNKHHKSCPVAPIRLQAEL
ncbi:flt3-interacting zinc finger protein-like [Tropilaelaps mercedesae]|uniref:Flt3-interacting zinc finger protein-like n=1 Tax=Tropilaelaps mercedesae TaxID=418985 RepID=A0A1V9XR99_9ACAR|nr:flt3-interacting zinc finger protein-like [Tropilaelaps mercedesae]